MNNKPEVTYKEEYKAAFWEASFEKFTATVYVPDNDLEDDVINYGFIAPYLLVFSPEKMNYDTAVSFAREKGFDVIAKKYASSVVYIYPTSSNGWADASSDIYAEILSNSKIHQYYEDGMAVAHNRFTGNLDGYFIRGAIFRSMLYGYGPSADYIADNCICHFEGDGLWGRADSAPTACILNSLSHVPSFEASDIPIVSVNNDEAVNSFIKRVANHVLIKETENVPEDFEFFLKHFRRMCGILEKDPDLEKMGLIREPGIVDIPTSPDNSGDDKGTKNHKIGYFAFYSKEIEDEPLWPVLLCFHGGGDSALYIPYISGWAEIALEHKFLLVSIENHINSTATEMKALLEELAKKYPIDLSRVYASGFSMGGCKTWDIIQEYPDVLAAAAPMDATFEIGLNVFGELMQGELNRDVSVPVFYAGGEITPLPELPFQSDKCVDRMKYVFEINKIKKEYVGGCTDKATKPFIFGATANSVRPVDTSNWENKIWGVNGDKKYVTKDPDRLGVLTIELFESENGKCYSAFSSIDNQGHECRKHTCENAWRFMSNFRRLPDGSIEGGDINSIYNCFTY